MNINSLVKIDHNEKDEPVFIKSRSSVRRSILQVAFELSNLGVSGDDNSGQTKFISPLDKKRARRASNASLGHQVINISQARIALRMEMWSYIVPN